MIAFNKSNSLRKLNFLFVISFPRIFDGKSQKRIAGVELHAAKTVYGFTIY
jgi:hypothetical protein